MSEGKVTLFPAWRQAVHDFLAEFQYGDVVTHDWLREHFGLPEVTDLMTASEFKAWNLQSMACMEGFKSTLLQDHNVLLLSVYGEGYRWIPPAEQTAVATRDFEKDARKVFRIAGRRISHVRVDELTDGQRRENNDAAAKLATLAGMTRKALR